MAKKYVVQGSPGKYEVKEAKTQEEIRSGMTYALALQTAKSLNAKADKEKKGEASSPPTKYGVDQPPLVKSSDISQVIKNVYIKNGWSKKDIDSYFQGKPWQVSVAWLLQDIKDEKIKMPSSLPGEKDAFANLQENLAEARSKGESKYLNQYNLSLPKRPELPAKEEEETKKDVGTVEDKKSISKQKSDVINQQIIKVLGSNWGTDGLNEVIRKINLEMKDTSSVEYMTERPEDIARYIKDTREDRGIKSLNVPIENLEGDETGFVLRIDKDGKLEGFDERTGNTFNPRTLEVIDNDYFKEPILKPSDKTFKASEGDGEKETKEGDTRIDENGITWIYKNGEWVLYETPASDEGPKEGDTKIENGITYIFENGEWVVLPTGAEGSGQEGGGPTGGGTAGQPGSTTMNQFNNIPEGAVLVESDEDRLYLMYTVPGAGEMYKGLPIRMFYEVRHNDLYKAGILTKGSPYEINYYMTEEEIDDFIVAGTTSELPGNDPNTGEAPHPFLTFVDNLTTQAQVAPWLLDKQSISLLAEAALEGREVTEAEWKVTDWYQTHNEAEREWLRLYYGDPATATATKDDYKIQVSRALQAAGVTGGFDSSTGQEKAPPDALVSWIADKWVSGQWSESYASEQLALFADPFRSGVRDADFTKYVTSAGVEGLERTAEKEDRVKQLYNQWLGPVFGKLTDAEVSERAGRLRNDPDYEASLIEQLKNNRLGLFPQYTNSELSYEDIVTPWRNLTTSVWGEAADETEAWWQDMVATNDFTTGSATLRTKGLENNNQQVTIEATQALESALGEGSVYQNLGANQ